MTNQEALGALIRRVQDQDREAMHELIHEMSPLVYKFALRMCRSEQDAQDVAQETLLSVFRSVQGFRAESSPVSWLYSIARNACIKRYRKRKSEPGTLESLAEHHEAIAGPADNRHERQPDHQTDLKRAECALGKILRELDEPLKEVFVLRELEGLSAEEVADVLSLSVPAVKSRLHRARKAIQTQLEEALRSAGRKPQVDLLLSCRQLQRSSSVSDTVQAHICERIRACLLL